MVLDLSNLENSLSSLSRSLQTLSPERRGAYPQDLLETIEAGVIQNFEFSYELAWKTMKRWLAENVAPDFADGLPRRELFRRAYEYGLLESIDEWMEYHSARNLTSHCYDRVIAEKVLSCIPAFLESALASLQRLKAKNA